MRGAWRGRRGAAPGAGRGEGEGGESGPAPDERQGSRGIHHRRGSIAPIGCRGREPRSGGGRPAPGKPPQWRAGPRGRRLRNGGLSAAPARAPRAGSARPRATPPPQPLLPARRSSSLGAAAEPPPSAAATAISRLWKEGSRLSCFIVTFLKILSP